MRQVLAIARKEMRIYFTSPIAYVVVAVFLVLVGFLYYSAVLNYARLSLQFLRFQGVASQFSLNDMVFRRTFMNASVILLLMMPLLTMRLLAEEKKAKTTELLMTSPISLTAIIVGKYLAALAIYAVMLSLTLYMPVLMAFTGPIDVRPLVSSYLGMLLVGSVFLSVGIFASSLTESQVVAAALSFGILLLFWLWGWAASAAEGTILGPLFSYLSLFDHLDPFVKGLIDTTDVAYFVSMTVFGLFLAHRVIESERWK